MTSSQQTNPVRLALTLLLLEPHYDILFGRASDDTGVGFGRRTLARRGCRYRARNRS
jgi:hypothetical protein